MLLKFIMEFSEHNIIPYGIDTNPEAIKYAVEEVLPEFSDNFLIDSIDSFHSEKFKFDIIICNPFHSKKNINFIIDKYLNMLLKNGKLIFRVHDDVLEKMNISKFEDINKSIQYNINFSRGAAVSFGIIYKCVNENLVHL